MHATIDFAPPPGWRPRPLPTTLRRTAMTAASTVRRPAPRPAPAPHRNPSAGDELAVELGMRWWVYALAVVVFTVLVVAVLAVDADPVALVPVGFGWGFSLRGLCDYARRGARA